MKNKIMLELSRWTRTTVHAAVFAFIIAAGFITFLFVVKITGIIMGVM